MRLSGEETKRTLYRLETSYFVCGVEVDDVGMIKRCAPIVGWARGMNIAYLLSWIEEKKGRWERLTQIPRN